MTSTELLSRGWQHQQRGELAQAVAAYRELLGVEPEHPEAWFLLGVALLALGDLPAAAEALGRAVRLRPGNAQAHNSLGVALAQLGRREEAVASYREALRLNPGLAEARHNLGSALGDLGRLDEAAAELREALRLRPEYANAHNSLGNVLLDQGRAEEAVAEFREALRLRPEHASAHNNLGTALLRLGRYEEAVASFREAVRLQPGSPGLHANLGFALVRQERHAEAVEPLSQALRLSPGHAGARRSLALLHARLDRHDEAERAFRQLLEESPDDAEAHYGLGYTLVRRGQPGEGLEELERAVRLRPDHVEANFWRSVALLQLGDYERGWPAYEWRWRLPGQLPRGLSEPLWDGSPLEGRTLLLLAEQGLGDVLQFVRYAPLVKRRGGTVLLDGPGRLLPLLESCPGIDDRVAWGEPLPPFDVQAPLLSLPRIFGTTLQTVPAEVPYLAADPGRVERWREALAGVRGFRVGIVWRGNPDNPQDEHRSVPLRQFAALAQVPGVRLVSLQWGPGAAEARSADFPVLDLGEGLDAAGAFLDTAAVVKNLNLVITVDSAVAHLAGALAAPTWVALSVLSDWRWLHGREDSPWYPTMRLFRQPAWGDWGAVFGRLAEALRERAAG